MNNEFSTLNVPANMQFIAFRQTGFRGDSRSFGPGLYNLHKYNWADKNGPKSAIVIPNIDFNRIINDARGTLIELTTPAAKCYLNTSNFDTQLVVKAFTAFMDKTIQAHGGSRNPIGTEYAIRKDTILREIMSSVMRNQKACAGTQEQKPQQIKPVKPTVAPAVACPTGSYKIPAQMAALYTQAGWQETPPGSGCYVKSCPAGSTRVSATHADHYKRLGWVEEPVGSGCYKKPITIQPIEEKKELECPASTQPVIHLNRLFCRPIHGRSLSLRPVQAYYTSSGTLLGYYSPDGYYMSGPMTSSGFDWKI